MSEVRNMADYREMYLHMAREVEKAARILQQAQLDCEELYINSPEPELMVLDKPPMAGGNA